MSDLRSTTALRPKRTAREQFEAAGADSCAICVLPEGLLLIGGKGGDAVMEQAEWTAYVSMVRRWAKASIDQAGADEGLLRIRPRTPWAQAFASLERLVRAGQAAVSQGDLEELEDILQVLGRETRDLGEAVLRAEQLFTQGKAA